MFSVFINRTKVDKNIININNGEMTEWVKNKNPEQFQDTLDLAEDFDSPICLAYTMAKWLNELKVSFMMFWNSLGAFLRPNGITFHS